MAQAVLALADSQRHANPADQPLPAIPIATDALGRIMVEAVPYRATFGWGCLDGFVLRKRAIVAGAPMIRDSENVYDSLMRAEDAHVLTALQAKWAGIDPDFC